MPLPIITNARTPRHDLPYLFAGQTQKEAFVNEAITRIDALIQSIVRGERSSPPANPMPGDAYLVAASPTGDWTAQVNAIAVWAENQWLFQVPCEGMRVYDISNAGLAVFSDDAGWQRAIAPELPSGGASQDTELRGVVTEIVTKLHTLGIFSS